MRNTNGRGLSSLCALEGAEGVLDMHGNGLLNLNPEEWMWFRGLGGFQFGGLVGS